MQREVEMMGLDGLPVQRYPEIFRTRIRVKPPKNIVSKKEMKRWYRDWFYYIPREYWNKPSILLEKMPKARRAAWLSHEHQKLAQRQAANMTQASASMPSPQPTVSLVSSDVAEAVAFQCGMIPISFSKE